MQCRETMILRADRNVPVVGQMVQERLHKGCVDLRKRQTLQGNASYVATESQQQSEHIAIGFDGIGTQIALCGQILRKEACHE